MSLGKYTSESLNARLREVEDSGVYGFEAFPGSGKTLPFIGWFWREVDFDSKGPYLFGVMPKNNDPFDPVDKDYVGFMENNKWDYGYISASPEKWAEIKGLCVAVADNPGKETLEALNNAVQALAACVESTQE